MKSAIATAIFIVSFTVAAGHLSIVVGDTDAICAKLQIADRYSAMQELSEQGFQVLYFNKTTAILVSPAGYSDDEYGLEFVTVFPPEANIYIASQADYTLLSRAGRILHDFGPDVILESNQTLAELKQHLDGNLAELSFVPMKFTLRDPLPAYDGSYRSDIAQLLTHVSADSVEARLYDLQSFVTRHAMADNRWQVSEWIRQKFAGYGITDTQLQAFDYNGTQQYNVIATIPGTVHPDEFIIVGGHHDSRTTDINDYSYAPGADDNASGTVAALEMARVICQTGYQPPVSIRFVTFACEEYGLWGSKQYSQSAYDAFQNIRLMINHDMIANNSAASNRPVKVMPYDGALDYASYALQLTEQYTDLSPYYGIYNSGGTDSYPFWQKGYNVIFFNESEFSPVYHSDNDTVANLDPDYCAEVIKASLACTVFFADIPGSPMVPVAKAATQITQSGFTANWDYVDHADSYLLDVYTKEPTAAATDLFFSEYLEGGGNNKALEIYNGTGADIDLSIYQVRTYLANASTPAYTQQLSGFLADGDTFVIAHSAANAAILAKAELISSVARFDGDDQIALFNTATGALVDLIGRIGEDPGSYWGNYPVITQNKTLLRKSNVISGITQNPASGFPSLADEWVSYPVDTSDWLGEHSTFTISYVQSYHEFDTGSSTYWLVQGLAPQTSYFYRAIARNDYFASDPSNEMRVITSEEVSSPVELVSFTATIAAGNSVQLQWTTQSETGLLGYYVYRGVSDLMDQALLVSPLIPATNSSMMHDYTYRDEENQSGTSYYWLQPVGINGSTSLYGPVSVEIQNPDGNPVPPMPARTALLPAYPNPFNPYLHIPFELAAAYEPSLSIYNSRGQLLKSFSLGLLTPGRHSIVWDGKDEAGRELSSGIYLIIMQAGSLISTQKAVLAK